MHFNQALLLLCSLSTSTIAAETILGVYIFSRHGDRTPKSLPPTNLTSLGYKQIYDSGTYYRKRYIASNAPQKIAGVNSDTVRLSQLAVSAPQDNVLMNSAQGFLQALYPPVGNDASTDTLRNSSKIEAPMEGYQLIPISTVSSGTGSEDAAWLQGAGNCANAQISSNNYLKSSEYMSLSNSTLDFYKNLTNATNSVFSESDMNFKNAYSIFDLINVASIHNSTTQSQNLPTPGTPTFSNLLTLSNTHEYSLAYNASGPIRAISGSVLAAEILTALNATLSSTTSPSSKAPKLTIQFGAYASFLSFFGLTQLPSVSADFTGVNDYASSMTFELFTTAPPPPSGAKYADQDINVRFLFNNGSSAPSRELQAYPLFNSGKNELGWPDFVKGMKAFSVDGQEAWCHACGNTTGVCASAAPHASSANEGDGKSGGSGGGISKAVAGVIGAMVTLAVILGVEALVLLLAGLRIVKKRRAGTASPTSSDAGARVEKGREGS